MKIKILLCIIFLGIILVGRAQNTSTAGFFTNLKTSGYNALTIGNNIAGYAPGMTPYTGPLVLTIKSSINGDAILHSEIYFFSWPRVQKLELLTYWWSDGNQVNNPIPKASFSGDQIFTKIRFAFYQGKQVLIFGDASTSWANASVAYVKGSTQFWSGGYDMTSWTLQPFTGSDTDLTFVNTVNASRESQLPYWESNGTNLHSLNSGNVLIGKTSQTGTGTRYKLDVEGPIRAHEIVVNSDGADFVFEPTYKLRTLSELETFIRTNKHLPDIAPAREMQQNGVSAGEMQAKLLQKVEELTLYVIEKNKEIADHRIKIEKQALENLELRKLVLEMQKEIELIKSK